MIDIAELQQYFPRLNRQIISGKYTFIISLDEQEKEGTFIINLNISQKDTKIGHLIKFRLGMGKDKKTGSKTHDSHKPHFEISIYKREERTFSADVYFTFNESSDEKLMEYAKGTVVIITKIINSFIKNNSLNNSLIQELVFEKEVIKDLGKYEPKLIEVLYDCYTHSELTVRQKGKDPITISTPHNLKKYLDIEDLQPLYLPLLKRIEK